jgi:hypothetical protein
MEPSTTHLTGERSPSSWVSCPLPTSHGDTEVTAIPAKTASQGETPTAPPEKMASLSRFSSGSYYGYSHETFALKYQTSDGDTFELTAERESFEMAAWSQGTSAKSLPGETDGLASDMSRVDGSDATETKQDIWSALHDVMKQVKQEMQQQQLHVLKALLGEGADSTEGLQGLWAKLAASRKASEDAGFQDGMSWRSLPESSGEGLPDSAYSMKFSMEKMSLEMEWEIGEAEELAETETSENDSVPEYWNAENTANRIVDFAMQFAGLGKETAGEFIAKMRDAIDLGFSQASQITGALHGKTAKLNQDTHQKIHDKLDQKLAESQATPYNLVTSPMPVNALAAPQTGSVLNLAA